MPTLLRSLCARLSVILNLATGGANEPLCARIARHHGVDCLFCRLVARALNEADHCARQLR